MRIATYHDELQLRFQNNIINNTTEVPVKYTQFEIEQDRVVGVMHSWQDLMIKR